MKRKPKAYRRAVRKQQVIKQLMTWYENGHATEATSHKLARALDITPSGKFNGLLRELVDEGILGVEERDQSGRWTTRFYRLLNVSDLITEKWAKRRILVKHKGRVSGQLELWS